MTKHFAPRKGDNMTSSRSIAAAAALAAFLASSAFGQSKPLESEITYYVQTAGGQTAGCGVDTKTIIADDIYRKGAMTGILATFFWSEHRGNIGIILKVIGMDFNGGTPSPFKVSNAFMAIKEAPIAGASAQCEGQFSFCSLYWLPSSASLLEALDQGNLSLGFNREPGGLDIVFPIDGSLSKPQDAKGFMDFHRCVAEMSNRARSHLSGQ